MFELKVVTTKTVRAEKKNIFNVILGQLKVLLKVIASDFICQTNMSNFHFNIIFIFPT